MDVLTSPCVSKAMTTQGHPLRMRHVQYNDWKKLYICSIQTFLAMSIKHIALFPRWNLMGILILRGILKLNRSISSKKPFAWVRANVQSAPNICSEEKPLEMCTEDGGGGEWSRLCVLTKLMLQTPPNMNYDLNQTTSNDSSETFYLKFL